VFFHTEKGEQPLLEDLYVVTLLPDEFHELLSEYENFFYWCQKTMTPEQKELAERVCKTATSN